MDMNWVASLNPYYQREIAECERREKEAREAGREMLAAFLRGHVEGLKVGTDKEVRNEREMVSKNGI